MLKKRAKDLFLPLVYFALLPTGLSGRVSAAQTGDPADLFSLGNVVGGIYNLIYPIAIVYGVLEIIIAGYGIMKSEGEPRALGDAKAHLTDSIVGVLFVMLAAVILKVIMKSFLAQDLDL